MKHISVFALVWFALFLWHINCNWLFNGKVFLYMFVKYKISYHVLSITSLNEPKLIFFTQLNVSTYFNKIWTILFIIYHLFTHSLMLSSIGMYNSLFN